MKSIMKITKMIIRLFSMYVQQLKIKDGDKIEK